MIHFRADRTLRRQTPPLKIILKVSFSFLLFLMIFPGTDVPDAAENQINCRAHDGPCSQSLPGIQITLGINPRPVKAMQDLVFRVSLSGEEPDRPPYIDLGMPGMKMGPNRVILKKISRTAYEGKGVIVRCPSGRRTWQATVTVPGKGQAGFIFDVVY